jgi:hypothetical protein
LIEVWYRTAVIYDLLCFTFFFAAAYLYITARKRGGFPGKARAAAVLACYILALDSKEVAVALPAVLLAYELLIERPEWGKLSLIATMALLNLPYIVLKTYGAHAMTNNPAYRPEYSWTRLAHSWAQFLNYLSFQDRITPRMAILILGALPAVALAFRSRKMLFAWLIIVIATLPVSFLPYRGGFVLYVSYAGWALYGSLLLVRLQDLITLRGPQYRTGLACLVFLLAGWRFGKVNLHDQKTDPRHWLWDDTRLVREMADQMRAMHSNLPEASHILFIEDSSGTDEWTPYFVMKLLYHDDGLVVDRIKMMNGHPKTWDDYQYVFTYRTGTYRQLKP